MECFVPLLALRRTITYLPCPYRRMLLTVESVLLLDTALTDLETARLETMRTVLRHTILLERRQDRARQLDSPIRRRT